jgi:diguanylate cyclase (GGDEF)-like protein
MLAWVVGRNRVNDSWLAATFLSVLTGVWCACQIPWVFSRNPQVLILANQVQYIAISLVPILWLRLCQIETGINTSWYWFSPLLLVVPGITLFYAFSYSPGNPNPLWIDIEVSANTFPNTVYGTWFWVHSLQGYTLILTGCLFLYGHFSQSPHYRKQMFISCAIPVGLSALNFLYISRNWFYPLDPTPFGFCIAICFWIAYGSRGNIFNLPPVARTLAMDRISDCIFILDKGGLVADYNTAAARLLKNRPGIIGTPLVELIENLPPLTPTTDRQIIQTGAHLYLEVNVSSVETDEELSTSNQKGRLVVSVRDVTRSHTAQKMLLRSRRELQQANEKLNRLANTDELTGLANRRFLLTRLDEEIARARRLKQTLGVLFIDLDHFKQVNDVYGHGVGDKVLVAVAKLMLSQHRKGVDIASRYGGEEMVLVVTNSDRTDVFNAAERLWRNIDDLIVDLEGYPHISVTTSIGIAFLEDADLSGYDLISRADQALYHAKSSGRNRVCVLEQDTFTSLFQGDPKPIQITS